MPQQKGHIMGKLEKVELVREKCGVSYEEAREALEACDGDVLDAIIWLERAGKAQTRTATYTTTTADTPPAPSAEMVQAQQTFEQKSRKPKFGEVWERLMTWLKRACRAGLDTTFVAERNGTRAFTLPVLVLVIGLFLWGATIWLLIIGLFLGFRYHFEGKGSMTIDVNEMMDKAADGAESIKRGLRDDG